MRSDPRFAGGAEHVYDSLLVPGYNNAAYGDKSPQYLATAPDSIQSVDLRQALASLQAGMEGINVKRVKNYGYSKEDYERMQLKPEFSDNAPGVVDATIANPELQQLLSIKAMKQRLV